MVQPLQVNISQLQIAVHNQHVLRVIIVPQLVFPMGQQVDVYRVAQVLLLRRGRTRQVIVMRQPILVLRDSI